MYRNLIELMMMLISVETIESEQYIVDVTFTCYFNMYINVSQFQSVNRNEISNFILYCSNCMQRDRN